MSIRSVRSESEGRIGLRIEFRRWGHILVSPERGLPTLPLCPGNRVRYMIKLPVPGHNNLVCADHELGWLSQPDGDPAVRSLASASRATGYVSGAMAGRSLARRLSNRSILLRTASEASNANT